MWVNGRACWSIAAPACLCWPNPCWCVCRCPRIALDEQILDAGQDIVGVAVGAVGTRSAVNRVGEHQVQPHTDAIIAIAGIDLVTAGAAVDRVIAGIAEDGVGLATAFDAVVANRGAIVGSPGTIREAVDAMMAATKGEYKAEKKKKEDSPVGILPLFIVLLVIFMIIRNSFRRPPGIFGRRRSPWGGGPFFGGGGFGGGGFGGGSFGGGGGFSGGGGSFGGGGASGRW